MREVRWVQGSDVNEVIRVIGDVMLLKRWHNELYSKTTT
jgi:hypothetical protein